VSFLRRLLGGPPDGSAAEEAERGDKAGDGDAVAEEQARDRELLLDDARRLDDDLLQRQLRYADRSWTPPAQGGTRRADDEDAERE
jgi:hypothetical protein